MFTSWFLTVEASKAQFQWFDKNQVYQTLWHESWVLAPVWIICYIWTDVNLIPLLKLFWHIAWQSWWSWTSSVLWSVPWFSSTDLVKYAKFSLQILYDFTWYHWSQSPDAGLDWIWWLGDVFIPKQCMMMNNTQVLNTPDRSSDELCAIFSSQLWFTKYDPVLASQVTFYMTC